MRLSWFFLACFVAGCGASGKPFVPDDAGDDASSQPDAPIIGSDGGPALDGGTSDWERM